MIDIRMNVYLGHYFRKKNGVGNGESGDQEKRRQGKNQKGRREKIKTRQNQVVACDQ